MSKFLLVIRPENREESNGLYKNAITSFGGEVVLVNDDTNWSDVFPLLIDVEGILLPGGDDVGKLDYLLIDYAINNHKKLLGICQGMQSMGLYGSDDKLIFVDDDSHYLKENYCHEVKIDVNSNFYEIVREERFMVNSYHHQTIKNSYCFKVVGRSKDGLIEVIESDDGLQIGVQWHPERMLEYDDIAYRIIEKFIR